MRWITREKAKVDRIACPWLIMRFIDPNPEFVFLRHDTDWSAITDGTVFDVPNAQLGHHGEYCSFDAILSRYGLEEDLALVELAKIVRAADTPRRDWAPEGAGLEAIADGFRRTSSDDFDNMRQQFAVYNALYACCRARLERRAELSREPREARSSVQKEALGEVRGGWWRKLLGMQFRLYPNV